MYWGDILVFVVQFERWIRTTVLKITFLVIARILGDEVVKECFNLPEGASQDEIKQAMASAYCNPRRDRHHVQQLDFKMKERLNKFSEQIAR